MRLLSVKQDKQCKLTSKKENRVSESELRKYYFLKPMENNIIHLREMTECTCVNAKNEED